VRPKRVAKTGVRVNPDHGEASPNSRKKNRSRRSPPPWRILCGRRGSTGSGHGGLDLMGDTQGNSARRGPRSGSAGSRRSAAPWAACCPGAIMMYASPLVDKFRQAPPNRLPTLRSCTKAPPSPFHNRSTGGTEGWWDFGDGSALEPFTPHQEVHHAYLHRSRRLHRQAERP